MEFSFKQSKQSNEFISQLSLGQVIKVTVKEKIGPNQFLIIFNDLQLTAVSDFDLISKSVWLKVNQLKPFPKLKLIIEDNESYLSSLFEYIDKNNLNYLNIPLSLSSFLELNKEKADPKIIYEFILWYIEKSYWSSFSDAIFLYLINRGITYQDLINVYSNNLFLKNYPNNDNKNTEIKLISSDEDLNNLSLNLQEMNFLPESVHLIEKINKHLTDSSFKLSMLCIISQFFKILIPVEIMKTNVSKKIAGFLNTKHFGKISFRYEEVLDRNEITFYFESFLFLNSLKPDLTNCLKNKKINLFLALYDKPNSINELKWNFQA